MDLLFSVRVTVCRH